jgi:hypothetical protein
MVVDTAVPVVAAEGPAALVAAVETAAVALAGLAAPSPTISACRDAGGRVAAPP